MWHENLLWIVSRWSPHNYSAFCMCYVFLDASLQWSFNGCWADIISWTCFPVQYILGFIVQKWRKQRSKNDNCSNSSHWLLSHSKDSPCCSSLLWMQSHVHWWQGFHMRELLCTFLPLSSNFFLPNLPCSDSALFLGACTSTMNKEIRPNFSSRLFHIKYQCCCFSWGTVIPSKTLCSRKQTNSWKRAVGG